jgi:subtilisin family serine protease
LFSDSYEKTLALLTVAALVLACTLACTAAHKPPRSTQELPWGIKRIGADLVWPSTTGRNVRVAVLDTGIETSHPDLVVAGGGNCVGHSALENNQAYSDKLCA